MFAGVATFFPFRTIDCRAMRATLSSQNRLPEPYCGSSCSHSETRSSTFFLGRFILVFRNPLCGRSILEVVGLYLRNDRLSLWVDVRQHRRGVNAYPEDQDYQRCKLPCFPRVQIFKPLVGFVCHLPEKHPLIKPQHISRAQDDADSTKSSPKYFCFERTSQR